MHTIKDGELTLNLENEIKGAIEDIIFDTKNGHPKKVIVASYKQSLLETFSLFSCPPDISEVEKVIIEAVVSARTVQEFLWGDESFYYNKSIEADHATWIKVLQKRVDKIKEIEFDNDNYKVELRKRFLQMAALSIASLQIIDYKELT